MKENKKKKRFSDLSLDSLSHNDTPSSSQFHRVFCRSLGKIHLFLVKKN